MTMCNNYPLAIREGMSSLFRFGRRQWMRFVQASWMAQLRWSTSLLTVRLADGLVYSRVWKWDALMISPNHPSTAVFRRVRVQSLILLMFLRRCACTWCQPFRKTNLGSAELLIWLVLTDSVPVKPTSKQYAYIIVQQPDTLELMGFRIKALRFGSVRSVHGFLHIVHRLWYVLVKEFKVLLTNYFDDFVAASPTSECSSTISCLHVYFICTSESWGELQATEDRQLWKVLHVCAAVVAMDLGVCMSIQTKYINSWFNVLAPQRL